MGDAATCEYADPTGTGDTEQNTTTGLAFWRNSTNMPTFTDGYNHWALTPGEFVWWTGTSIDPPFQAPIYGVAVGSRRYQDEGGPDLIASTPPPVAQPSTPATSAPPAAVPPRALPPPAVAPTNRTIVVLIGGLLSQGDDGRWDAIKANLRTQGYQDRDFFVYSYDGWSVAQGSSTMALNNYSKAQTCNALSGSEDILLSMLRYIRDNHWAQHVALVGHSLGGVVAMDTLVYHPELSAAGNPFLRSVVTIDSPLQGVNSFRVGLWEGWFGASPSCPALEGTVGRNTNRAWSNWLASQVNAAVGRGVNVNVVVNNQDCIFNPAVCGAFTFSDATFDQAVNGSYVNHVVSLVGGSLNHTAALADGQIAANIGRWIEPQGQ